MRNDTEIIFDIEKLTQTNGFIYSLCLILFEEFNINPEKVHEINPFERLNMNEASLLIGFLVKSEINLQFPKDTDHLFEMRNKAYELLKELHQFYMNLGTSQTSSVKKVDFGKGNMLIEPIFYAGTGVYDFQYLNHLNDKYKYDEAWLYNNKGYYFEEVKSIFNFIKKKFNKNAKQVNLHVRSKVEALKQEFKDSYEGHNFENEFTKVVQLAEIHQYANLFFDESLSEYNTDTEEFREASLKVFYNNLLELFVININELKLLNGGEAFYENFVLTPQSDTNSQFNGVGDYNVTKSHPLLKLDRNRLFLPIPFILAEAIYESPFYWMMLDKSYIDQCSKNRGCVGEDVVYQLLHKVFGENNTFKEVIVQSKKGYTDTDIDVLCTLGNKAICFQIKSQKLTLLSRKGNDKALQDNFQKAVQEAYDQAWVVHEKILDKSTKFFNKDGEEIFLPKHINKVYMSVITTENYPALTHQAHTMLELKEGSDSPLAMTTFDLELVTHYLSDPYDFLYYIRQRVNLINHFYGDNEMCFLGYHLINKLWRVPDADLVTLSYEFAQLVDRNYYPVKAGLTVSDEGDAIKSRWKNKDFNELCAQIKTIPSEVATDVIFNLYDLSSEARESIVINIKKLKSQTLTNGKPYNFSIPPSKADQSTFGLTYYSYEQNSIDKLYSRLMYFSINRKYISKADAWIGLGSINSSDKLIDCIIYNDNPWQFDSNLELESQNFSNPMKIHMKGLQKINRNDKCPCNSGKKFKHCCINR